MGSALIKQEHLGAVYNLSATNIREYLQCHTSEYQLGIYTYGA